MSSRGSRRLHKSVSTRSSNLSEQVSVGDCANLYLHITVVEVLANISQQITTVAIVFDGLLLMFLVI